jgi:cytochrome b561
LGGLLNGLRARQHLLVTLLAAWLILTSPWLAMLRRLPDDPGWLNLAHVWLGLLTLLVGAAYLFDCIRGGGWRQNFPWTPPQVSVVGADLRGLLRGRIPAAEGGGLFGALAGLTLLALLAAGATGAGWLLSDGGTASADWRAAHIVAARALIVLLVLHIVAVCLHVLDLARD